MRPRKPLLALCGYSLGRVSSGAIGALRERVEGLGGVEEAAKRLEAGVPTLRDIVKELLLPGRDHAMNSRRRCCARISWI